MHKTVIVDQNEPKERRVSVLHTANGAAVFETITHLQYFTIPSDCLQLFAAGDVVSNVV